MLMRGDMNKLIEEVNKVLEGAFVRIQHLEDKVQALENAVKPPKTLQPASKAKAKVAQSKKVAVGG